ncbi:zinc ribbon domain-containing protein [uncultured Methanobrevibacter sp.]|nr:zinc ribbon domain-containing protein [uncultured Methanobrevibacter sp.]
MVKREKSWNMGIAKKIVIVLGIIIITYLMFTIVYNHTQPNDQDSLNVITDDGSHLQTSSYPYKARISYEGSWYAEMGDPNYLVKEAGDGTKTIVLDCAPWERVCINAQKEDYGEGELKIELLKDDQVVAKNTTSNAVGNVVINYNY